jgi:hypothetical protein
MVPELMASRFSGLRKLARKNSMIFPAIRDFVKIYSVDPGKVEVCLAELGLVF